MAGIKFYLNGEEVEQPDGFSDFKEELIMDYPGRILRFDYPLTLTFFGRGWEILNDAYIASLDSVVGLKVTDDRRGDGRVIMDGLVRMINCEWNFTTRTVECQVDDSTYQGRVFNRMEDEVGLGATVDIDGNDMVPLTPFELTMFEAGTGTPIAEKRKAYDVKEAMGMLISYVSGGKVGFESDWYDALPVDERMCLVSGLNIRDHTSTPDIVTSLEELFNNLWKKDNLFMIVENPLTAPTIRLESEEYLFSGGKFISIDNVVDLKRSLDYETSFNRVNIGSEDYVQDFQKEYALPYFRFYSMAEESYAISGNNAVKNTLELISTYVIDANAVELALTETPPSGKSGEFDAKIFMIQYNADTLTAVPSTGSYSNFYNERLLNMNVAQRFNLYGDLILALGLDSVGFRAERKDQWIVYSGNFDGAPSMGTQFFINGTLHADDDSTDPNYDAGGNYTLPDTYTAPIEGVYRFRVTWVLEWVDIFPAPIPGMLRLSGAMGLVTSGGSGVIYEMNAINYRVYNQLGELMFEGEIPGGGQIGGFGHPSVPENRPPMLQTMNGAKTILAGEHSVMLEQGDTVQARGNFFGKYMNGPMVFGRINMQGSFWETVQTPTLGGQYTPFDPDAAYVNVYSADKIHLPEDVWEGVRANPVVGFRLNTGNLDPRIAFTKKISRKFVDGESELQLLYNRKQNHL